MDEVRAAPIQLHVLFEQHPASQEHTATHAFCEGCPSRHRMQMLRRISTKAFNKRSMVVRQSVTECARVFAYLSKVASVNPLLLDECFHIASQALHDYEGISAVTNHHRSAAIQLGHSTAMAQTTQV